MSKSLKNVVNPDDIIAEYGADSLRLYEMYMADFKDSAPWDTKGIIGVVRFLEKSERLFVSPPVRGELEGGSPKISTENDEFTMKLLHKTIKKVGEDIENYKFNTAIAALMILVNNGLPKEESMQKEWKSVFIRLLHPFAPHIAEELNERLSEDRERLSEDNNQKISEDKKVSSEIIGNKSSDNPSISSVYHSPWPKYDEKMVVDNEVTIGVQVMGKVRGEVKISKTEEKDSALEKAKSEENVAKFLNGKTIVKEIYVPGKIINFVVK
ncbi:hypothetical protein CSB07_02105 [Candidatus Gracilibacteria bacterium]|nr:MAG: hypothetical protein CSB07_02105 [Candidatus Gracilibacteria bacterium]